MFSKYFTLPELCRSKKAEIAYITNIPSWAVVHNLQRLAYRLDDVRTKFGCPVYISSGYRSEAVNHLVGGAPKSYHLLGLAADIYSDNLVDLYDVVKTFPWTECYINENKHYIHVAL